jgi:hypothetical protein
MGDLKPDLGRKAAIDSMPTIGKKPPNCQRKRRFLLLIPPI